MRDETLIRTNLYQLVFTFRQIRQMISSTINYLETYINIELKTASFKACQFLPVYGFLPALIVETVFFEKKSGVESTKTDQREEKLSQR